MGWRSRHGKFQSQECQWERRLQDGKCSDWRMSWWVTEVDYFPRGEKKSTSCKIRDENVFSLFYTSYNLGLLVNLVLFFNNSEYPVILIFGVDLGWTRERDRALNCMRTPGFQQDSHMLYLGFSIFPYWYIKEELRIDDVNNFSVLILCLWTVGYFWVTTRQHKRQVILLFFASEFHKQKSLRDLLKFISPCVPNL